MAGVYGKLATHGDFVRRGLPQSFVRPWDEWLQAGLGGARDAFGAEFDALWAAAPVWRFRLPAGACGESAVAGVLLTSQDSVGRQFPLTLATLLAPGATPPGEAWYAALEHAGVAGRDHGCSVDALLATLPAETIGSDFASGDPIPPEGWWTHGGRHWSRPSLPTALQFRTLLRAPQTGGDPLVARAASHPGTIRVRNEDAFVNRSDIGLWAVADGAGGLGAGDVASAAAAAALADLPPGLSAAEVLAQVRLRLGAVHAELQRLAATSTKGERPATTVAVLMARGDHFACLWAGDSRVYLLRDGELSQVTHDHSVVQELIESGLLEPEAAEDHPHANIITRAVGSPEALELDKVSGRIQPGDVLLLCSDGLFKALPEHEIKRLLAGGGGPDRLIERALEVGARDNVTALTVEV